MDEGKLRKKINKYFYDNKIEGVGREVNELLQKIETNRKEIRNVKQIITDEETKEAGKQIEEFEKKVTETRKEIASVKGKIKRFRKKKKEIERLKKENSFFKEEDIMKYIKYGNNYWRH